MDISPEETHISDSMEVRSCGDGLLHNSYVSQGLGPWYTYATFWKYHVHVFIVGWHDIALLVKPERISLDILVCNERQSPHKTICLLCKETFEMYLCMCVCSG